MIEVNIIVHNPPSSGANLSENTEKSILCYAAFVEANINSIKPFSEFRKEVSAQTGTNIKNDRTIYPMFKYLGLISYDKLEELNYSHFFTPTGIAYVKFLRLKWQMQNAYNNNPNDKNLYISIKKVERLINEVIFHGLQHLFQSYDNNTVSYRGWLIILIKFLLKFNSINKDEFAYLVYFCEQKKQDVHELEEVIKEYRRGKIKFSIIVDAYDKTKGATVRKRAKITNLTAFGYQMSLLAGAGIVSEKEDRRFYLNEDSRQKTISIVTQAE